METQNSTDLPFNLVSEYRGFGGFFADHDRYLRRVLTVWISPQYQFQKLTSRATALGINCLKVVTV